MRGIQRFDRVRGGAFERGLMENIKDAYHFLIENYQLTMRFFFGFSRSAYTARGTVGLIDRAAEKVEDFPGVSSSNKRAAAIGIGLARSPIKTFVFPHL